MKNLNRKQFTTILLVVNILYTGWYYMYGANASGVTHNIEVIINVILWVGWIVLWIPKPRTKTEPIK